MTERKTLILAYPPFTQATSPPLGVCMLKGFIERELPNWRVKVVDLNLRRHQQLFYSLGRGHYPLSNFEGGLLAEVALSKAEECFLGVSCSDFYSRPDRYTIYAELYLRLMELEQQNTVAIERAVRGLEPMNPTVVAQAEGLLEGGPSAIGISVCYTQQLWSGLALARAIKERSNTAVILGGTFFNEGAAELIRSIHALVDYIIVGEGEVPLKAVLESLGDSSVDPEANKIPGVVRYHRDQIIEEPPTYVEDLDYLGKADFSDLDLQAYYSPEAVVPILTSRGCYWRRCAFCSHYKSAGMSFRRRSIGEVIKELREHTEDGRENFAIIDEMISPSRFRELARGIIESGLKLNYYALAKPSKRFDTDLLGLIAKSGGKYLLWGLESGSQRMLDLMSKGTKLTEISKVLESASEAGVANHVYIMAGFPTETKEDYCQTLKFLESHKEHIWGVHRGIFQLEQGSPVFDCPAKYGVQKIYSIGQNALRPRLRFETQEGLSGDEIRELFSISLPFLRVFNPYSIRLGNFRDHALLIYSRNRDTLRPEERRFPVLQFS